MSQIYDMYRMVKIVKREVRRLDRQEPQPIKDTGAEVWHPATANVKKIFLRRRPWLIPTDTAHVVADCIQAGYLLGSTSSDSFGHELDTLCVTKDGRKLTEKTLFLLPTGLWKAWYEDNGKLFIALITAIIVLLTALVTLLLKITLMSNGVDT